MPRYKFGEIAINSTAKKKPTESDKDNYLGLEHLDSGNLSVTRFSSEVAPIGEKLLMKKGDVLFGKRRAYQKKLPPHHLMESSLLTAWCFDPMWLWSLNGFFRYSYPRTTFLMRR